jgi:hypothetical protein
MFIGWAFAASVVLYSMLYVRDSYAPRFRSLAQLLLIACWAYMSRHIAYVLVGWIAVTTLLVEALLLSVYVCVRLVRDRACSLPTQALQRRIWHVVATHAWAACLSWCMHAWARPRREV